MSPLSVWLQFFICVAGIGIAGGAMGANGVKLWEAMGSNLEL